MIIFGQQDYAERLRCYLNELTPTDETIMLSFSLNSDNPAEYNFDFSRYDKELDEADKNTKIIVAFGTKYREKAIKYLKKFKFNNVQIFDAEMDNNLKRDFFKKQFAVENRDFNFIGEEKSVEVYLAKSAVDKPLKNYPKILSKYIVPIQVGAALTKEKIAEITDDAGDNISAHNRHFSETTALYWIWKNAKADYLGLCHYRRLWENLDFIAGFLQNDRTDVVLPTPTLCVHSVLDDYMEKYIPDVYPIMLDVLKEMSPKYFEAGKEIYAGQIFYACNMLIAKRDVLNALCEWMFPIVFEIEKRVGDLPDSYQNRYAGFCAERLITLYFLHNKDNFKIAHADKIFIE